MQVAKAKAPGKLMLVGEHAVVYGYPCLVTAVNKFISVTVKKTPGSALYLPANSVYVKSSVSMFFQKYKVESGLSLTVSSDFDSKLGLGSSSAVTVATLKALARFFAVRLSQSQFFDLAFLVAKSIHSQASGFDIAASVYSGTLYYQKGTSVEHLPPKKMPLLVVYTGIKAKTACMVKSVANLKTLRPDKINWIFKNIGKLVGNARTSFKKSDWRSLGRLFNLNQQYLVDLGVSTAKIDRLVSVARENGAFGAKLSGAGGGDCLIVLYPQDKKRAIINAVIAGGGQVLDVL